MTAVTPVPWTDDETLRAVRPEVRALLERSPGFSRMGPEEQRELARTMVKVCSYMSNPDGLAAQELSAPNGGVLAKAQADEGAQTHQKFAGKDFEAGAIKQGVQQFGELVKKVDFPKFVSGLIQGVFQAIVDSSIQQMRAYGELLANVAKTVDQFAQDNITANNARDWLADRFPDQLSIDTTGADMAFAEGTTEAPPQPTLVTKGDDADAALKAISEELMLAKPVTDLSDPAEEQRLVLAARLQIARSRQQLLSSMVILGINRIVVTDGLINAKVVFDMKASDSAKRVARASQYDSTTSHAATSVDVGYSSWFSPVSANMHAEASTDHVATVESSVGETSESKADVKAKLSGEVRVNFKSDYFPMEKLANPQMIAAIQGNAVPPEKPVKGA
ncbi:MAG TPA: hypothetical protein VIP11_22490 [Gemmatimonadaceae bacterium]